MARWLTLAALAGLMGCAGGGGPPVSDGGVEWAAPEDTPDGNALAMARHSTECDLAEPAHAVFAAGRFLDHAKTLADAVALLDREAPDRRHGLIQLPQGAADVEERCTALWEGPEPPAPHILGVAALAAADLTIAAGLPGWRLLLGGGTGGEASREVVADGPPFNPVFDVAIGPPGADPVPTTVLVSTGATMTFLLAAGALPADAVDRYEVAGAANLTTAGGPARCRRVAVRWRIPGLGIDRLDVALVLPR